MTTSSVSEQMGSALRNRFETVRPTMAKADLKNLETDWKALTGKALARCFSLAGVSQKEAAALIGRDQAQVARWVAGTERPQVDALLAVETLRQWLVVALAEVVGLETETTVRIRRSA